MIQLGQKGLRDARQARIYSLGRPPETSEPAGSSRASVLSCNSKALDSKAFSRLLGCCQGAVSSTKDG
jgi:hypothetical protein